MGSGLCTWVSGVILSWLLGLGGKRVVGVLCLGGEGTAWELGLEGKGVAWSLGLGVSEFIRKYRFRMVVND